MAPKKARGCPHADQIRAALFVDAGRNRHPEMPASVWCAGIAAKNRLVSFV